MVSDVELPNREELIKTAVNFLLNPNVRNKPDETKKTFLKSKGLTDSEIAEAFRRRESNAENAPSSAMQLPPVPYRSQVPSFFSRLSGMSSSLIVVAVALYGLHYLYKTYILPWLFGIKPESKKRQDLERLLSELTASVSQLKETVATLESTVKTQTEQIECVFLAKNTPYMPIPMAITEIKTEISNVKTLLVNRHQFPAVPKVAIPSIPSWQLVENSNAIDSVKSPKEEKQLELTDKSVPSDSVKNTEEEHSVAMNGGSSVNQSFEDNEISDLGEKHDNGEGKSPEIRENPIATGLT